ncbi:NADH-quinone oxidoreductase subunit J [Nonomuraea angiospora]|uniref:NADH-quinone oxidoreductase subunit J n=1 Tax=Nonomuraea angiospora TaxID=46172 RepID=UPI0029BDAA52|nr:NADH-quinone oxidoreductase subunit J [Nonomuraea angiospora]MDX3111589.1 NADH-quinone oxidoreductase subunit J [Nonomuraea angiospora]
MTEAVPSYLSPTGQEIVFLLLGAVAVGSALLVVTTKQLVHAALWLVVSFGALAGCYLVLTAEFVAWVQVLIYVGAVVVLMLFGIMLTRAPIGRSADLDSGNRLVAALVAVATAAILVTVVIDGFRTAYTPLTPGHGAARELGASVFATWVLPFEALSVLLLAALIGAIVLSRTDIPGGSPSDQTGDNRPPDQTSATNSPTGRGPAPRRAGGHSTAESTRTGDGRPPTRSGESSPTRPETSPSPPDIRDDSVPDPTGGNLPPDQTGGH